MKKIILFAILLTFSYLNSEIIIYGFSDDLKYFAFAYEPKDPMALSGGLRILNVNDCKLAVDTILNEFNDSYSSLKDVSDMFAGQYASMLGFEGGKTHEELFGNAENGRISILNLRTPAITYFISKSVNEYGYYDYSTTIKIENEMPVIMNSKITDIYGAYITNDSVCTVITKGLVMGFEGTFYEDYNCFSVKAAKSGQSDSIVKENAMKMNIMKVKSVMSEFFSEHHNIYPNNVELLNRYGKAISNPMKKQNESVIFVEKLMKFASKYEGTIVVAVPESRESYKIYYGEREEFREYKEGAK